MHDVAGSCRRHQRVDARAGDSRRQEHLASEELSEPRRDRGHGVASIGLALGAPEVPARDDNGVALAQPVDRGQRGGDPQVVVDVTIASWER